MKQKVVSIIKENLLEIIPALENEELSLDDTFVDLGANSLDRGELITMTLERLESESSRVEFVGAQTINELADMIVEKG